MHPLEAATDLMHRRAAAPAVSMLFVKLFLSCVEECYDASPCGWGRRQHPA